MWRDILSWLIQTGQTPYPLPSQMDKSISRMNLHLLRVGENEHGCFICYNVSLYFLFCLIKQSWKLAFLPHPPLPGHPTPIGKIVLLATIQLHCLRKRDKVESWPSFFTPPPFPGHPTPIGEILLLDTIQLHCLSRHVSIPGHQAHDVILDTMYAILETPLLKMLLLTASSWPWERGQGKAWWYTCLYCDPWQ